MVYEIANGNIQVSVNSIGAELMSIKSGKDGLEYLWQGDPKYWGRRSPTLFPIIGMLKSNKYSLKGSEYDMEPHGFAKTSEFQLVERTAEKMVLGLSENEDTLRKYPYKF